MFMLELIVATFWRGSLSEVFEFALHSFRRQAERAGLRGPRLH
jgi:hypothetical protein